MAGIDVSAIASVTGIETEYEDRRAGNTLILAQRLAVIGQGNTASTYLTTKRQVTSALEGATLYGFGSPIHLALLQIFPLNGDGVGTIPVTIYPLVDDGSGVVASGDITPAATATITGSYRVNINNILSDAFIVTISDTAAAIVTAMTTAINAVTEMPMIATDDTTDVGLTSKWKGLSANDLVISVVPDGTGDEAFAYTQPVGGLVNPTIDAALAQMGDVWETMVLNCLNVSDTISLVTMDTFGEGRWGALTHKPLVSFVGNTETTVANATAVSNSAARLTDRTNGQLVAPGSIDLPFVVAARELARIVVQANNNPAVDYVALTADGLTPGADGDQWLYVDRNSALTKGSSTITVADGKVKIDDTATFYHPTGDPQPPYRKVVTIVKLQNIIFNINYEFAKLGWAGAPLIPDSQLTTNPAAKKPKIAKAAIGTILDGLGLAALISDPTTAKKNTTVQISTTNPDRLQIVIPVQVSGNTNQKDINLKFGFFYGTAPIL